MARTAVVAGVGPGLGASLVRKFAAEGCDVGLIARSPDYISDLADEVETDAVAATADVSDREAVANAFGTIRDDLGTIDILVTHASDADWSGVRDLSADEFTRAWEVTTLGAFHCIQEALPDMLEAGEGTIVFTGATSAVRGNPDAAAFASAKFAARGLAESMARDLGPEGIHVAHVVIDGGIDTDREGNEDQLDPDAIAETYWHLVEQDRSSWTLELDLRPHVEEF